MPCMASTRGMIQGGVPCAYIQIWPTESHGLGVYFLWNAWPTGLDTF
jgi:hypothetical protein